MTASLAVLGGGIAGATTAFLLAKAGVDPLWIAPRQTQTFKPGEHLGAAAQTMLNTMGLGHVLDDPVHRPAHAVYSAWGSSFLSERNAIVQLDGTPTVLDRIAFEAALEVEALSAGARRIYASARDIQIKDRRWQLETDEGEFQASFLIDATGRKALVASKFATRFQADRLSCLYGQFKAAKADPMTLVEAVEEGWWYLSTQADGLLVLNFYSDADLKALSPDRFEAAALALPNIGVYLQDASGELVGPVSRHSANSTWFSPVIGPGWAAVGDASAAYDPLSSHGMTTALWTAQQVSAALVAQDQEKMQAYNVAVAKGVAEFLEDYQRQYAQEQRWADRPFWKRRLEPKALELA